VRIYGSCFGGENELRMLLKMVGLERRLNIEDNGVVDKIDLEIMRAHMR